MPIRILSFSLTALLFASSALAQSPESLAFSLDRVGPPPVRYTLTVDSTGKGTFAQPGNTAASTGIVVGSTTLHKLLAAIPVVEGGRCETHAKGIAKTGTKVLSYTGGGHDAQCTYNYSDQDRLNDATAAFEGIAETLQFGDRLRAKLRFDRLGLSAELEELDAATQNGRALEVANIAPVLKLISGDDRVMELARRRAEKLLAAAAPDSTPAVPAD